MIDQLFRHTQDSHLTTAEISRLKHILETLVYIMQETEVNGRFRRLETKMDNVETKVDSANRHKRNKVRQYEHGATAAPCTE